MSVGLKIGWQQNGVRREACGLHHSHRRKHAELARFVSRGSYDTTPGIVSQSHEPSRAIVHLFGRSITAAADNDRLASEFRVSQQFDGRVERIHIEVSNSTYRRIHDRQIISTSESEANLTCLSTRLVSSPPSSESIPGWQCARRLAHLRFRLQIKVIVRMGHLPGRRWGSRAHLGRASTSVHPW
jgi:hypothetical protein